MDASVIKQSLQYGGVFGLALSLALPIVQIIVLQSGKLRGRSSDAYRFRLLRLSLFMLFGTILVAGAAWTFTKAWPPSFLARSSNTVTQTGNSTSGASSPIIGINSGTTEIGSDTTAKDNDGVPCSPRSPEKRKAQ
jgi:hypothetical protein